MFVLYKTDLRFVNNVLEIGEIYKSNKKKNWKALKKEMKKFSIQVQLKEILGEDTIPKYRPVKTVKKSCIIAKAATIEILKEENSEYFI